MSLSKLWEMVKDGEVWRAAVHRGQKSDMTEGLNNSNNGNKNTSKSFNQNFSNIINVIIGSFNSQLKCKSIKHK